MPRMPQPPSDPGKYELEISPDGTRLALMFPAFRGERTRIELAGADAVTVQYLLTVGLQRLGLKPRAVPRDN